MTDGKGWHLEKRCSPKTKEMFILLDKIVQDNFELDGPNWNQKHYVSYRISNFNWLSVITTPNFLRLDFLVKANAFNSDSVSKRLNIAKFDKEESLSEKFGLPSSVFIKNRNENTDRMYIRVKDDFNLEAEEFIAFLKDAYKAFPK